jgi:hypothetical protein
MVLHLLLFRRRWDARRKSAVDAESPRKPALPECTSSLPGCKCSPGLRRSLLAAALFLVFGFVSAAILVAYEGPVESRERDALKAKAASDMLERELRVVGLRNTLRLYLPQDHFEEANLNLTILADLSESLIEDYENWPIDGEGEDILNWTYVGALYYIFTVITTIGYGTFACSTWEGKMLTIVMGFFGIASFTFLLSTLSAKLADAFKACTAKAFGKSKYVERLRVTTMILVILVYWALAAWCVQALSLPIERPHPPTARPACISPGAPV